MKMGNFEVLVIYLHSCTFSNILNTFVDIFPLFNCLTSCQSRTTTIPSKYDINPRVIPTILLICRPLQLAEVEGVNFELTDRVSDLEQQLESIQANSGSEVNNQLEQDLTYSDQVIDGSVNVRCPHPLTFFFLD